MIFLYPLQLIHEQLSKNLKSSGPYLQKLRSKECPKMNKNKTSKFLQKLLLEKVSSKQISFNDQVFGTPFVTQLGVLLLKKSSYLDHICYS